MGQTMGREFMSPRNDPPHHAGVSLRDPPEREKSSVYAVICKQLQNYVYVPFDATFTAVPLITVHD
jgi:hypothetical protein